jgi:hypothetical protein
MDTLLFDFKYQNSANLLEEHGYATPFAMKAHLVPPQGVIKFIVFPEQLVKN